GPALSRPRIVAILAGVSAATARKQGVKKARVLAVDDDPDILHAITGVLSDAGFAVDTAKDGEEALEQLMTTTNRPNLIVLDLKMPRRSGYELLAVLRKSVTLVDVPVVVLSAHLAATPPA